MYCRVCVGTKSIVRKRNERIFGFLNQIRMRAVDRGHFTKRLDNFSLHPRRVKLLHENINIYI